MKYRFFNYRFFALCYDLKFRYFVGLSIELLFCVLNLIHGGFIEKYVNESKLTNIATTPF